MTPLHMVEGTRAKRAGEDRQTEAVLPRALRAARETRAPSAKRRGK
jgi:hypothetical protein